MKELLYCILHEQTVEAECLPVCGHIALIRVEGEPLDLDYCEFPLGFAYCEPPEVPYFEREPYLEDLLENQEVAEQELAEILFDLLPVGK